MMAVNYSKIFGEYAWKYKKARVKENDPDSWRRAQPLFITGPSGIGKTKAVLEYLNSRDNSYYFSFQNISENLAIKLFSEELNGPFEANWSEFFSYLDRMLGSQLYAYVVFDGIRPDIIRSDFASELKKFLAQHENRNVFIILVGRMQPEIEDDYYVIDFAPFTIGEVKKSYPLYSDIDLIRLYALTDGYYGLLDYFSPSLSVEQNLRNVLSDGSSFFMHAETRYREAFRSPESYSDLLYAMTIGKHKLTELARFSAYAPNKCDKYLRALLDAGIASTRQSNNNDGRSRTEYYLSSSFMTLWTHFIMNGTSSYSALPKSIMEYIDRECVPRFFRKLCSTWVHDRADKIYGRRLRGAKECFDVTVGDVIFDYVQRDGDRMIFIKIWDDLDGTRGPDDYIKVENAVTSVNLFYNSQIILCSLRRFRESMWKRTREYANVHLMEARSMITSDVNLVL